MPLMATPGPHGPQYEAIKILWNKINSKHDAINDPITHPNVHLCVSFK